MKPEVIALGEPLLEFNARKPGKLHENTGYELGYGGDTSNFAIAASRAGVRVGYICRVGEDDFGQVFLDLWQREGIDTRHVIREEGGQTGIYFVSRHGKEHSFTYYRRGSAASHLSVKDIPRAYIAGAQVLHTSGISQAISTSACDAVFHAIAIAREAGVTVSYDPNYRPKLWSLPRARAIVWETIRQADVVLPSLEDMVLLTGLEDPAAILERIAACGPRIVVLKMGPRGAMLAVNQKITSFGPVEVEVVDTTGAGDAFDGAFIAAQVRGLPAHASAEVANLAAAQTTTAWGAVMPIPSREQMEAMFLAHTHPHKGRSHDTPHLRDRA